MDQVQDIMAIMQQWRSWGGQLSTEVVTKQAAHVHVNYLSNQETNQTIS